MTLGRLFYPELRDQIPSSTSSVCGHISGRNKPWLEATKTRLRARPRRKPNKGFASHSTDVRLSAGRQMGLCYKIAHHDPPPSHRVTCCGRAASFPFGHSCVKARLSLCGDFRTNQDGFVSTGLRIQYFSEEKCNKERLPV